MHNREADKRRESFLENAVSRGLESGIEVLLISTKLYFRASYNPDNTRHCFLPDFSLRPSRFTRVIRFRAPFIRPFHQQRQQPTCPLEEARFPAYPRILDKFEITALTAFRLITRFQWAILSSTPSVYQIDPGQCPSSELIVEAKRSRLILHYVAATKTYTTYIVSSRKIEARGIFIRLLR